MLTIRRAAERFPTKISWLDSKHTFSFGEHYDPKHMGFRALRVINEDRVAASSGFPTHGHQNMEILSWVLDGELEHKDSLGTGSIIKPGELQRMSAGTGVRHSEWNPSMQKQVHFLQIWLLPERAGLEPSYEQKSFAPDDLKNQLRLVASQDARKGTAKIHQDASLFIGRLDAGTSVVHDVAKGRGAWVHIARGKADVNGTYLGAGDGGSTEDAGRLSITAGDGGVEVLVFDLGAGPASDR